MKGITKERIAHHSLPFSDLGQQYSYEQQQYVPPVHEADNTYTVPARQSLVKPVIGGGAPIQSLLLAQPQYVYVTAPGAGTKASTAISPAKTLYQQEQQTQQQQQYHHSLYAPSAAPEQ